jgi:hypothetical protein
MREYDDEVVDAVEEEVIDTEMMEEANESNWWRFWICV